MKLAPSVNARLSSFSRVPRIEPETSLTKTAAMRRPASFFSFQSCCAASSVSPAGMANGVSWARSGSKPYFRARLRYFDCSMKRANSSSTSRVSASALPTA